MQVAHDFFECEENGGDRSVEGGGKRSGPTDGEQPPYLRLAQPQPARDDRRDSGSDVDRGSFASQRDAAGERSRAADEFADDRSERDASVVNENRGAGLWNSAAAGEGEVAIEKVAGKERAERGDEDSSPAQSAGRIHVRGESSGEENECDDDESDQRADEKAQYEGEAILLAAEVLDQPNNALRKSRKSGAAH